jgi:hypothetical protein
MVGPLDSRLRGNDVTFAGGAYVPTIVVGMSAPREAEEESPRPCCGGTPEEAVRLAARFFAAREEMQILRSAQDDCHSERSEGSALVRTA